MSLLCTYRPKPNDKFAPRSCKGIFGSYPYRKKGWKIYYVETHEIFVSRDVVFHERVFPFATNKTLADDDEGLRTMQENNVVVADDENQIETQFFSSREEPNNAGSGPADATHMDPIASVAHEKDSAQNGPTESNSTACIDGLL